MSSGSLEHHSASCPGQMSVECRTFQESDYAAAFRLWQATEGIGLSEADSPEGIRLFLSRNPGLSLVAVESGELVGTILCGHDGRRGLIHHLAVRKSHRRTGLGSLLVRQGIARLRVQGIGKCHVFVHRANADARAFWLRIGGEERTSLVVYSLPTDESG